jgi:drug/metabolite transporter (DMT)-like permease
MNPRDFALLLFVCLAWAAHTIISKIVVTDMAIPPLYYATVRYGLVALVTLPWLLPLPRPLGRIALVGFLMGGGGFAFFFAGMKTASPSGSAIVQQLALPLTVLLSIVLLGEIVDLKRGIGIALAFLGAILVMWDPSGVAFSWGLVLILGSTFAGSFASVMMKKIHGIKLLQFQAWVGVTSVVPLAILSAAVEEGQVTLSRQAGWPFAAAVLFSALVVSLLAHTTYYKLLIKYPANLIAPLMLVNPLMTVSLGILITGDSFNLRTSLGTAIVLLGVLTITLKADHLRRLASLLDRKGTSP